MPFVLGRSNETTVSVPLVSLQKGSQNKFHYVNWGFGDIVGQYFSGEKLAHSTFEHYRLWRSDQRAMHCGCLAEGSAPCLCFWQGTQSSLESPRNTTSTTNYQCGNRMKSLRNVLRWGALRWREEHTHTADTFGIHPSWPGTRILLNCGPCGPLPKCRQPSGASLLRLGHACDHVTSVELPHRAAWSNFTPQNVFLSALTQEGNAQSCDCKDYLSYFSVNLWIKKDNFKCKHVDHYRGLSVEVFHLQLCIRKK